MQIKKAQLVAYRDLVREARKLKARKIAAERQGVPETVRLAEIYAGMEAKILREIAEIERKIERIDDPAAREVLRMRYIDGKSRAEVARRLYMSERQVNRIVKRYTT